MNIDISRGLLQLSDRLAYRRFVLAAVKQNGLSLAYADDRYSWSLSYNYRRDSEVVLAAVKQNGLALSYAIEDLCKDREIVLAAVIQNGSALAYADDAFKDDQDFLKEVVSNIVIDCADDSTAESLKDKLKKDMLKREIKKVEEVAKCLKDQ